MEQHCWQLVEFVISNIKKEMQKIQDNYVETH